MSGLTLGSCPVTGDQFSPQTTPPPPPSSSDGEAKLLQSAPTSSQYHLSDKEAMFYYFGLPSSPRLVARSSATPWVEPTGPEAYRQRKELRPVGNHKLNDIWESELAPAICNLLESNSVNWTSIDVVRIANAGESSAPVILWLGISPETPPPVNGSAVALACKELLEQYHITDVEVELRESAVTRSAGPKLMEPAVSRDPTVNVRRPLTATLGLSICAKLTPWAEGTGGFFMAEGGHSKKIFLVTARHVLFPRGSDIYKSNVVYEHKNKSQPRCLVLLLGNDAFQKLLDSIQAKSRNAAIMARHYEGCIEAANRMESMKDDWERKEAEAGLEQARRAKEESEAFHQDVSSQWSNLNDRVLGHVVYSPSISVGTTDAGYTEDFAIVEVDTSKISAGSFKGNVIDLGAEIAPGDFTQMMYPSLSNPESFSYPLDRLLPLRGIIPEAEIRKPTTHDHNGEPCIMVIKRGNTTGLTIGRANNIFSYVRNYFTKNDSEVSKEWAILPLNEKSGPFSEKGDSGSVIADGSGRMGGLLTGGSAGTFASFDITYATPLYFLKERITQKFRTANFNPVFPA